jgi:hypothetical protein
MFAGYYRLSDEEIVRMWSEGVFVFDANVLLNIYRYSPPTREMFLTILERLKEQIWVPHQAAFEYHRGRLNVISYQAKAYDEISKLLRDAINQFRSKYPKHSSIDIDRLTADVEKAIGGTERTLQEAKSGYMGLLESDDLLERITSLFDDRVGAPFTDDQLKNLYREAEERYKHKVPPGYEDAKKPIPDKYGDFVLWHQVMDYAVVAKKPILFVTDDRKSDWWLEHGGRTLGPRPELVHEIKSKADVLFYMYPSDRFIEYAQGALGVKGPEAAEALKEIASVSVSATPSPLKELITTFFTHIASASDYEKALELYSGPQRTLTAFITLAERPQTLAEISQIIVADGKWTDAILGGLIENGLVYRQEGWPNTYHLTDYGRRIRSALDQLPTEVKEESFHETWMRREEILGQKIESTNESVNNEG